jgi:hypothetical protein
MLSRRAGTGDRAGGTNGRADVTHNLLVARRRCHDNSGDAWQRSSGWTMSRLDSFIRRLEAQRACLDASPALIAGLPGPIVELGLGNGRTYDHLRGLYPDREIFVFERQPAAHPDCIPDEAHLVVGDIRETLPSALAWLPGRAALVHNDIGTGDLERNAQLACWLAAVLPPLVRAKGVVISDQRLDSDDLVPQALPGALPEGRYFLYRRG